MVLQELLGFGDFVEIFKQLPTLFKSLIDIFLMLDDVILIGVKMVKFFFGDLIDLAIIFIENLISLAEPIMEFVFSAVKALEESKEIPAIIIYGSPIFVALNLLFFIINNI